MAFQPSIVDHPTLPGAVLVSTPAGDNLTIPRDRLPQIGLAQSGATAQNMSIDPRMSVDPGPSQQPQTAQDFSTPLNVAAPQAVSPAQSERRQVGMPRPVGGGVYEFPDGSLREYVPGAPKFEPAKYAASLVDVPTGKARKVEGAFEFNPERQREIQEKEMAAAHTKAQADILAAQNDARTQSAMGVELEKIAAQQQAELAASEDRYRTRLTSLESEAKQVASRQVNPNRVAQGMNWFQKLGFILASAFSGGATKGQRNIPLEQFHDLVNSDVAAQEQEIARSKGVVDNALSRLSQEWGSIQAGKSALRVQQFEVAKQRIQTLAAQTNTSVAQVRAQAAVDALAAAQAKDFEQLRVASMGHASESLSLAPMAPRAGGGGGWREAPLAKQEKLEDLRKKRLDNAKSEGELTGALPNQNTEAQVAQYGQRRADSEQAQVKLDRFLAENGIKEGKDGNLIPPSDIAGMGRLGQYAPNVLTSQQGINNRAALESIVYSQVRAAFGAANDAQVRMIADKVIGNGTPEHITAQLNQLRQELEATRTNIDASYPAGVRSRYDTNKGQARSNNRAKNEGFQPVNLLEGTEK